MIGKARHYLGKQWPNLIRYVENGVWHIDKSVCENTTRPFVVGRRNWLFDDAVGGAQATANLYSLLETCKPTAWIPRLARQELFQTLPTAKTVNNLGLFCPKASPQQALDQTRDSVIGGGNGSLT